MEKNDLTLPPPPGGGKKVVVIGGGVTGALSAFELIKAGHNVTLIEAGDIGNGSSRRSAACIRQQFETPSTVRGMRFCKMYYDGWNDIVGGTISPVVNSGYLFLKNWEVNMEELSATVKTQQDAGLEEVQILKPAEINKLFPYIETTGITCATWCPTDGFLYPDLVFLTATEAAKEAGATIIKNDGVVSVKRSGNTVVAVQTKSGKVVYGDIFVNAGGAWAPLISKMFDGAPISIKALKRYLYFIDGYAQNATGHILQGDLLRKLPMIITPRGCYCRPESYGSDRIMLGWLHHTNPIENPTFEDQDSIEKGFSFNDTEGYGYAMRKEASQFIPDITLMKPLYTVTSGLYEDTPDHNPFIGYDTRVCNLIHCAGFSGHGLMQAPFSGRVVTLLVNEGKDLSKVTLPYVGSVDVSTFQVDREFSHVEGMVI